jgi:hypothetical protein
MHRIVKTTGFVALAALVVIQFIHPAKNSNAAVGDAHLEKLYAIPEPVQGILHKACYDCHSNITRYPWYSRLQPIDWWLADHIEEGKEHLNFSEFGTYRPYKRAHKLEEVAEEIEHDEMPLSPYKIMHGDAKLSPEEKTTLMTWAQTLSKNIYAALTPEELAAEKKRKEERGER